MQALALRRACSAPLVHYTRNRTRGLTFHDSVHTAHALAPTHRGTREYRKPTSATVASQSDSTTGSLRYLFIRARPSMISRAVGRHLT